MEETKKTNRTPVVLKRSRLGLNLKSSVKTKRTAALPNGNGLNTSDEKSENTPDISAVVEEDKASMSVRNKEICRLHMEETNSINNAQNPDSKIDTNQSNNTSESNKDFSDLNVKKEASPSLTEDTVSVSNADNSEPKNKQTNGSDVSDTNKDSCVVKTEIKSFSSDELMKNGDAVSSTESSDNNIDKPSNSESLNAVEPCKDLAKTEVTEPVKAVSKPVKEVIKPVKSVTKPNKEVVKSINEVSEPVNSATKPVEVAKPIEEVAKPVKEVTKPVKEESKNKQSSKQSKEKDKTKEEEAQSSGSEEFHGFDSDHTEKSIKARQEFIENSEENEVTSSAVPSTPSNEDINSKATPFSNKRMRKAVVDLSNPMFRKPFEFGWKRELVYRATNDDGKRQGDIYYYTPSRKKVRSAREVMEHITDPELSVDNFTFCKEPLGLNDPEKEIIRDAKIRLSKDFALTPPPKAVSRTPKAKATVTPVSPTPKATPKLVIKTPTPSSGGLKVKFTGIKSGSASAKSSLSKSKPAKVKKRKSSSGGSSELEMGMLPPMWSSPEIKSDSLSTARSWSPPTVSDSTKNVGKKRSADKSEVKKGSPPTKKVKVEKESESAAEVGAVSTVAAPLVTTTTPYSMPAKFASSHYLMGTVASGYSSVMHIFRYLNLKELLIASRVCRLWNDVASKPHFWQTVRMKNTQVSDWNGFANALIKHETKHLDLRKMLVGSKPEEVKANWLEFYNVIARVKSLKRIELCRCQSSVIENLAKHVPHLESLTATAIKSPSLNLEPLGVITNLTELRLKGMSGLELTFDHLSSLSSLKLLSITAIKNLNDESSAAIGSLENLETLEIGDCNNINEKTVTEAIPKLINLKRLRLEKGQNSVPLIIQLIESASKLPQLEILELINFDVKPGFDVALGKCTNIKSLLMIPTYITQSATTNHIVMIGVSRLASTLKQFVWGLTLELLRVTDLFIDQCETSAKNSPAQSPNSNGNSAGNKKGKGDSIPILKPLIDTLEEGHDIKDPIPLTSSGPSKVDILPIPKLRKVLSNVLPTTDIKILKIPFSSTWRQTLV